MRSTLSPSIALPHEVERPKKRSLLLRALDALIEARYRQAEREIGRVLRCNGGLMTDETEREIERRFFGE